MTPSSTIEVIATGKRITLILPAPSPSLNEVLRQHRYARSSMKDEWAMLMACAIAKRRLEMYAIGKRRVTVERHGKRVLDDDNLVGGLKSVVIDNLRKFAILVDDKPAMMELRASCVPLTKGAEPHTVVIVEDI